MEGGHHAGQQSVTSIILLYPSTKYCKRQKLRQRPGNEAKYTLRHVLHINYAGNLHSYFISSNNNQTDRINFSLPSWAQQGTKHEG